MQVLKDPSQDACPKPLTCSGVPSLPLLVAGPQQLCLRIQHPTLKDMPAQGPPKKPSAPLQPTHSGVGEASFGSPYGRKQGRNWVASGQGCGHKDATSRPAPVPLASWAQLHFFILESASHY